MSYLLATGATIQPKAASCLHFNKRTLTFELLKLNSYIVDIRDFLYINSIFDTITITSCEIFTSHSAHYPLFIQSPSMEIYKDASHVSVLITRGQ